MRRVHAGFWDSLTVRAYVLHFIGGQLFDRVFRDFRRHSHPVDIRRQFDASICFYGDFETRVMQRVDERRVQLKARFPARDDDPATPPGFVNNCLNQFGARQIATGCEFRITLEPARRLWSRREVALQVTSRETKENGDRSGPYSFTLDSQKNFVHPIFFDALLWRNGHFGLSVDAL